MRASAITIAVTLASATLRLHAQSACRDVPPILVGSEWEQYLRAVQVAGKLPLSQWTVRDFGPQEWNALVPNDTTLPWSGSASHSEVKCIGLLRVRALWPRM